MTDEVLKSLDVSRETIQKLHAFEALVRKWYPKINLVSKASIEGIWKRHILDSIQIFFCTELASDAKHHWVDLGSGGGFPGIVLSILGLELTPRLSVTLVESDQRKSAFLRTVRRELGLNCRVVTDRIERLDPQDADILSARALADLSNLFEFADRHLAPDGTCVFPKGATWKKEISAAQRHWKFDFDTFKSGTDPNAVILAVKGITRV